MIVESFIYKDDSILMDHENKSFGIHYGDENSDSKAIAYVNT